MDATLEVFSPATLPEIVEAPETRETSELRMQIAEIDEFRRFINNDWFILSFEMKAALRCFPQFIEDAQARSKSPSFSLRLLAAGKMLYHLVFDYVAFFGTLRDYQRAVDRLVETIHTKMRDEEIINRKLFESIDSNVIASFGCCSEHEESDVQTLSATQLTGRRDARKSRATN